jgi:ATP-dependent exoDNAse (exonuclease V) alpha subunit
MFEKLEWGSISTVHKFQGSEAHTIIAVFLGDFVDHNTIQLLYTAASRAKQRLVVIMEEKNLSLFCTRPGRVPRNTRFNQKLQKALAL